MADGGPDSLPLIDANLSRLPRGVIHVRGIGASEAASAVAGATMVGGSEMLRLSDGTQITFSG